MTRVEPINDQSGHLAGYMMAPCPGCGLNHLFHTVPGKGQPTWSFNGDVENPTFHPSMLVTVRGENPMRCHFFLREGNIQFLSDCSHALAGKTVPAGEIGHG